MDQEPYLITRAIDKIGGLRGEELIGILHNHCQFILSPAHQCSLE